MSQEKSLVYDSPIAKVSLFFCYLTMPLWGVGAPLVLTILITAMLFSSLHYRADNFDAFVNCLGVCFYSLLTFFMGAAIAGMLRDTRLQITPEGLIIPPLNSFTTNFNRSIDWSKIQKVVLTGAGNDLLKSISRMRLEITIRDQGIAILSLSALAMNDIEYLLVSFSNFLPQQVLDEKLEDLKQALWNANSENAIGGTGGTLLSFTKMWEDELTGRFAATAYVPLNPGERLQTNHLKIIRQLAFGGWSAIYLAQEANTKLRVLKESVIPPGTNATIKDKAQTMFLREADLLLKLNHPQIVKVYQHFSENDRHYLLLDYISGQTVRQTAKLQGPFHQLDVLAYSTQLCDILNYLHGQNPPVLHRDLTPDNLIIDSKGRLMLIDFGAANELIGTATGTMVGKQSYISTEQFQGKASQKSDLYAMGATLHFMLTGVDPEPLSQSSPAKIISSVFPELDQIVQDLTEQEAGNRPNDALEIKKRLEAVGKVGLLTA